MQDHVRVLRVIEYSGPRDAVEEQIKSSIHGEEKGQRSRLEPDKCCIIRVATIGNYPEIIDLIDTE